MIDVALPRFGDGSPAAPTLRQTSVFGLNAANEDEEYHFEHSEIHEEEDDGAGKDEFFDTEEMAEGVSALVRFRLFEFEG